MKDLAILDSPNGTGRTTRCLKIQRKTFGYFLKKERENNVVHTSYINRLNNIPDFTVQLIPSVQKAYGSERKEAQADSSSMLKALYPVAV